MNNILINKVKEQGIVNIITNYKYELEFKDILERFNNDWYIISCQRVLPIEFLLDNKNKLNMSLLSRFHGLTDEVLEILKDDLIWDIVANCAQLTIKQSLKYSDYINLDLLRVKY